MREPARARSAPAAGRCVNLDEGMPGDECVGDVTPDVERLLEGQAVV